MKIKTLSKNNGTILFSKLGLMGLLTFLFCLFLPNQIQAQTTSYQPFPTNYGLWHYAGYNDFGNYTGQQYDLLLQGDTLIDTVQYFKIYHNGISYNGAIREEAKKVYYLAKNASQERLLYDFNIGLGDVFSFINNPGSSSVFDSVAVVQVDSVLLSDGQHRRLIFEFGAIWIEGVGNLENLLEPTVNHAVSARFYLECMRSDTNFTYPLGATCMLSSFEDAISKSPLEMYPNPSTGALSLKSKTYNIDKVFIHNVLGQEVKRIENINDKLISIDGLKPGTYFIRIKDESGQYHSKTLQVAVD